MRSSGKLPVIAKHSRERLLFGQVRRAAALPLGQCFKLRQNLLAVVFDIARTRFGGNRHEASPIYPEQRESHDLGLGRNGCSKLASRR